MCSRVDLPVPDWPTIAISSPAFTCIVSPRRTRISRPASKKLLSSDSVRNKRFDWSVAARVASAPELAAAPEEDRLCSFIADDLDRRERARLERGIERGSETQDYRGHRDRDEVHRVQPHRNRAHHEHVGWQMEQVILADDERGHEPAQHADRGA